MVGTKCTVLHIPSFDGTSPDISVQVNSKSLHLFLGCGRQANCSPDAGNSCGCISW